MEQDTNPISPNSNLCRSGCGFYGNRANDGYCSKCYKDQLKRKQSSSPTNSDMLYNSNESHILVPSQAVGRTSPSSSSDSAIVAISTVPTSLLNMDKEQNPTCSPSCEQESCSYVSEKESEDTKSSLKEKKKNRCNMCRKKLGLTGFQCRCGGNFCGAHRYSNEHACTFDYKALGAQEIQKNNPLVVAEKVKKI